MAEHKKMFPLKWISVVRYFCAVLQMVDIIVDKNKTNRLFRAI